MIGLGLSDETDISIKGLEAIKKCEKVFLEDYTSLLQVPVSKLEDFYGKPIILADRTLVEQKSDEIILPAKDKDVAFLVVGDPMGATTHTDFILRCKEVGVEVKIIHNTSILNAIGVVGLQLYKFGKTPSLPYPDGMELNTPYDVLKQNQANGLHTLMLLDIKKDQDRYMSVPEAIELLLEIEQRRGENVFSEETLVIGCARIGCDDQHIKAGKAKDLKNMDFGKPPHCLIIPGKMHFVEEDMLKLFM